MMGPWTSCGEHSELPAKFATGASYVRSGPDSQASIVIIVVIKITIIVIIIMVIWGIMEKKMEATIKAGFAKPHWTQKP